MAEQERLADDEIVVRWIDRSDSNRFRPPDRVSSGNFKERKGERGVSVFRLSRTSTDQILKSETRGDPSDYIFVAATVGAIRALTTATGQSFHLDVVSDESEVQKPGHALIIGTISESASRGLSRLFRPLPVSTSGPQSAPLVEDGH